MGQKNTNKKTISRKTIFSKIIDGSLPASFVHQDDICVAFMDINPVTPGHTLVVPREQKATLAELSPEVRCHIWEVGHKVAAAQQAEALKDCAPSKAQNLIVNDGKIANQTVPHVHLHIIPRRYGDSFKVLLSVLTHVPRSLLNKGPDAAQRLIFDEQAETIARNLN